MISFVLDSPATVSLVTGPGRIERFKLKFQELTNAPQHLNLEANSLASAWKDIHIEDLDSYADIPLNTLRHGPWNPYKEPSPISTASFELTAVPLIQGSWSGYCMTHKNYAHEGLFRLEFNEHTGENGPISGKADVFMGSLEFQGLLVKATEPNAVEQYAVDFLMVPNDYDSWIRCRGILDPSSSTMTGDWFKPRSPSDPRPDIGRVEPGITPDGTFWFSRTPAPYARFRYTPAEIERNNARTRWSFAYAAILYQVQRDKFTVDFVMTELRKGRCFKELSIKSYLENGGFSQRSPFTSEEVEELEELKITMSPIADQFYSSTARHVYERIAQYSFKLRIVQYRLFCIHCFDFKKSEDSVDFCIGCQLEDEELPNRPRHNSSHSLIRVDRILHRHEVKWIVSNARLLVATQLKTSFHKEGASLEKKGLNDTGRQVEEKLCDHCRERISLPFWVSFDSYSETNNYSLVCDKCDSEWHRPFLPEKLVAAPPSELRVMLRIKDDQPVEIVGDDQLPWVERRLLNGVKNNVEERLNSLEKSLATHPSPASANDQALLKESVYDQRKGLDRVEARLETLEAKFTSVEKRHLNLTTKLQRLQERFQVWRVLVLLVDSGFIYCGLQLIDFIITIIVVSAVSVTSSLYQNAMIYNEAHIMISAFYPTLVTYLVQDLSSTTAIREAATVVYGSRRRQLRGADV
ncbi:hypothetical protein H0H92_012798 [Tricholoma furcatifolium]|nr:hypothetical protein H0H92_012798 [Tricholoma furcatifolium]